MVPQPQDAPHLHAPDGAQLQSAHLSHTNVISSICSRCCCCCCCCCQRKTTEVNFKRDGEAEGETDGEVMGGEQNKSLKYSRWTQRQGQESGLSTTNFALYSCSGRLIASIKASVQRNILKASYNLSSHGDNLQHLYLATDKIDQLEGGPFRESCAELLPNVGSTNKDTC